MEFIINRQLGIIHTCGGRSSSGGGRGGTRRQFMCGHKPSIGFQRSESGGEKKIKNKKRKINASAGQPNCFVWDIVAYDFFFLNMHKIQH